MLTDQNKYRQVAQQLREKNVILVAVSKTKPVEAISELYNLGQRDFGENYVQELVDKQALLPKDIRWHFIGHLQTNKVKYIASFVYLIHGVDSYKLLKEINKQAQKAARVIDVLLQLHIAREESKFGLDEKELREILGNSANEAEKGLCELKNIKIVGFMGMASLTEDEIIIRQEFAYLKAIFDQYVSFSTENCQLRILSMGMSNDYNLAIEEGSNMVRIGSLLFGARNYSV